MTANAGVMTYDSAIEHKLGCIALRPSINNAIPATTVMDGMSGGAISELGALNVGVLAMATADDTAWFVDPKADLWDCDFSQDLMLQLLYTNDSASSTGIIWKGYVKGFAGGAAASLITSAPDGSITFPTASVAGVGLGVNVTARVGFGAANLFGSDEMLGIAVELNNDGTAAADALGLVAARLWYTREICAADGVRART